MGSRTITGSGTTMGSRTITGSRTLVSVKAVSAGSFTPLLKEEEDPYTIIVGGNRITGSRTITGSTTHSSKETTKLITRNCSLADTI